MAKTYDAAISELHQAPFELFVSERKRLAEELRAAGDAARAAELVKTTRPPISAWAVNQLWWKEQKAFRELFDTAERLRGADADADEVAAHRDAISALRTRAAKLLTQAGKSASEATLRRVTSTLTALAATGGFDPDPPGALRGDRDPPGFEVAGLMGFRSGKKPAARTTQREKPTTQRAQAEARRHEKAAELAELRRTEREQAQKKAERERLERKLRIAEGVLDARREELTRLKEKISEAEQGVAEAREVVRDLEKQLKTS